MRTKSITYGESREVLLGNGQSIWKKANVEIELDKGDTEDVAYDHAEKIIAERFKEKPIVAVVEEKKEMDVIVKGWYDKAVREGDTKTIEDLEKEFIVPNA